MNSKERISGTEKDLFPYMKGIVPCGPIDTDPPIPG